MHTDDHEPSRFGEFKKQSTTKTQRDPASQKSNEGFNELAVLIDRHGAAIRRSQYMMWIDAELRIDRAGKIRRRDRLVARAFSEAVTRSDHLAPANAAACQDDTEDARPVIAAAARVELGRA